MSEILACGHLSTFDASPVVFAGRCTYDGVEVCYLCADLLQRLELLRAHRAGKSYALYLSGAPNPIPGYGHDTNMPVPTSAATWTGGALGTVVSRKLVKLSKVSYVHGKSYWAVQVRDVHGNMWHGRGSSGVVCTLRPMKAKVPK